MSRGELYEYYKAYRDAGGLFHAVPRRLTRNTIGFGHPMFIEAIDNMVDRVNHFKIEPQFTQWVDERVELIPDFGMTDEEILRRLVVLIAYSNNANAEKVTQLVESHAFDAIFQDYSIRNTAKLSPESLVRSHWSEVKAIRFKYKIGAMVRCAASLLSISERHGSLMLYLKSVGLPSTLKSDSDIQSFWKAFDQVRAYFLELHFPYFGNFTSLCHLLLDRGFDCAKPDIAVMRAAVDLGIVPPPPKQKKNPEKSQAHPEESLRKAVETIQAYGLCRSLRPSVIDIYFLIHGRQSGAIGLVKAGYYQ